MAITREFLESNPRSKQIREICVQVLNRVDALMKLDDQEDLYRETVRKINSQLEMLQGKLIDLNIRIDMNAGNYGNYETDPVFTAEYIAGQHLHLFINEIPSIPSLIGTLGEFSQVSRGEDEPYLLQTKDLPDQIVNFIKVQGIFNILKIFLDFEDDERSTAFL